MVCFRPCAPVAWVGLLICAVVIPGVTFAEGIEDAEARLRSMLRNDLIRVGGLVQVVGDYQPTRSEPGDNGFSIAGLRVNAQGELDSRLSYMVQLSFIRSPALLDARLSWNATTSTRLDAGAYKAPFSAEFLTPAANIDFVNRARVAILAPGRQIGVAVAQGLGGGIGYTVGVFNGNGVLANQNDGDGFMTAGRLFAKHETDGTSASGGVNFAWSRDHDAFAPFRFSGTRTLGGADVRVTRGAALFSAEVIGGRYDFNDSTSTAEPYGFHLTAGHTLNPQTQLLVRYDVLDLARGGRIQRFVVLGANVLLTTLTSVQFNYSIPTNGQPRDHQFLVNLQLSL